MRNPATLLVLLLAVTASFCVVQVDGLSIAASRERITSPFRKIASWVKDEAKLVRSNLVSLGHLSEEQRLEVQRIVRLVSELGAKLDEEEKRIHDLHHERTAVLLETPFWMFDKKLAEKRSELSMQIAVEERELYNTQDKIVFELDKVKGIIGIYSMVFAADLAMTLLHPMFETMQFMLNTFFSSVILFLFTFTPLLFGMLLFFVELRRALFPAYLVYHFALVAFNLPPLLLKYHPNPVEFAAILLPLLFLLAKVTSQFIAPPVYFVDRIGESKPKLHQE